MCSDCAPDFTVQRETRLLDGSTFRNSSQVPILARRAASGFCSVRVRAAALKARHGAVEMASDDLWELNTRTLAK
jgi:hypothetical protein